MNFLQLLAAAFAGFKAKINDHVAALPPVEQHEGEVQFTLKAMKRFAADMIATLDSTEAKAKEYVDQFSAEIKASAETELVASGKYVLKTDADAAMTAAVQEKEKEMRDAFTAELATKEKIQGKRKQLVDGKVLPAVMAEKLPDAVLGSDTADAAIETVKGRVTKLKALGLAPEHADKLFSEVAEIALDADGETVFARRLESISQLMAKGRGNGSINPAAGSGGAGAGGVPDDLRSFI